MMNVVVVEIVCLLLVLDTYVKMIRVKADYERRKVVVKEPRRLEAIIEECDNVVKVSDID